MKKKLNENAIVNELRGRSSFFSRPSATEADDKPEPLEATVFQNDTKEKPYDRTDDVPVRTDEQTVRPYGQPERPTKRHAFEIYEDQLARFRRLSALSELDGKRIGMSQMVRDALDDYLKTKEGSLS